MLPVLTEPLRPARDLAREWARHELRDPIYADAKPGLFERALTWLLDHLSRIGLRPSTVTDSLAATIVLIVVVVIVVALVLWRTGRIRIRSAHTHSEAVFREARRSAAHYRRLADESAAAGQWPDAVRERLRAIVATLQERSILDDRLGRTAQEAAHEAGDILVTLAGDLAGGARIFDDVCYGTRIAGPADDAVLRRLDEAVQTAAPVWTDRRSTHMGVR